MMEMVVTTGAIRREKHQWNRHHQQTNIQLFTGWMSFLSRTLKENFHLTPFPFNQPIWPSSPRSLRKKTFGN